MQSTHDFTFAWEHADSPDGPWAHLQVVRFHGREEISALYRYDLTLFARAPAPEIDLHALIGARATLRIATLTYPPEKLIHGVIVEAEEIADLPEGTLYRVLLMPPLVRAAHRTRSRIFLDKTTRQIVTAVLLGDPNLSLQDHGHAAPVRPSADTFVPAIEKLAWRIADPSRIDDERARAYCVQFDESDLAFVSRLLEEEGISYHFEAVEGVIRLVLSDSDEGKTRLDPFAPLGAAVGARHVGSVRIGARIREKAVRLADYDWRKPALPLLTETRPDPADLFESRWPGGFSDAPSQGQPLARVRLDRHRIEADPMTAEGTCRVLSAGVIFRLEHAKARAEGEHLVTRIDVHGEQHGVVAAPGAARAVPFTCAFEVARRGHSARAEASRYRPPRVTPRPRIHGSQTAFVTDDPSARGAEIHVGGPPGAEIGCVRLRFHWDLDEDRLAREPSSCWVRVSQLFAGAGEGALFHPRVGTEVIVEFLDGDPDRPIVTGRVYNGRNRPPAGASGAPTVSVIKSASSPGGARHNEISFDDAAGREQIKIHAGKNWDSEVGHDRSERVANHSTSSVGVHRTESTGGDRSTSVKGINTEIVAGDESISVGAGQKIAVAADQSLSVGASQSIAVSAHQTSGIGGRRSTTVGGDDSVAVGGDRSVNVSGSVKESVGGNRALDVSGSSAEAVMGSRSVSVSGASTHKVSGDVSRSGAADVRESASANLSFSAGADLSILAGGQAALQGASVHVNAAGEIVLSAGGAAIKISGAGVEITGGAVKIAGGTVDVTGSLVKIN